MNHEEYLAVKRIEVLNVAKSMLSGELHLIEGVRRLCDLRSEIDDPENHVFLAIRGIESETDHFPIGQARSNCDPNYLNKLDAEMESYLSEAQGDILHACEEIIAIYS